MRLYERSLFSDADMLPRLAASPAVIERKPTSLSDQSFRRRSSIAVCDSNVSHSVALYFALNEPRNRLASRSAVGRRGEVERVVVRRL